jgi:hypothetical protein
MEETFMMKIFEHQTLAHSQPQSQSHQQQIDPMQQLIQGIQFIAGGAVAIAQGITMVDRTLTESGILPVCAPDRHSPLR